MGRLHSDGLERGMIITISHHLRSIEGKDCHIWGLGVENGIEQAVEFQSCQIKRPGSGYR